MQALSERGVVAEAKAEKAMVTLLSMPLERYSVGTVLTLQHYPAVMTLLRATTRKEIAIKIVRTVMKTQTKVGPADSKHVVARKVFHQWHLT